MGYQLNKKIIWGINSENKNFGLGETFCLTPLFRYNRNSEMHFLNNEHGVKCYSVFDGMCHAKIFDDKSKVHHQVEPYGDISKERSDCHQVKNFLKIFGFEHDNYIPWIDLTPKDIINAKRALSIFKNPITISPVSGGHKNNCPNALSRMIPMEHWQQMIYQLKDLYGFDVICIASPDDIPPLEGVTMFTEFNYRQLTSIIKCCGIHIGIENGVFHAAVASGAKCFGIVPSFGWNGHLFFHSFAYTDDMWIHEPVRAKYYLFNQLNELINDVLGKGKLL